jgi:hypothetical protein
MGTLRMTFLMIFFLTTAFVGLVPVLLLVASSDAGAATAAAPGVVAEVSAEVVGVEALFGAAEMLGAAAAECVGCGDGEAAAVWSEWSCSKEGKEFKHCSWHPAA